MQLRSNIVGGEYLCGVSRYHSCGFERMDPTKSTADIGGQSTFLMKLIAYHIRILLNSFHPGYVSVFFGLLK